MVGRYPVELCCPLPVRKIIKHKSVPPKIKGGGGEKKVDIHNSCQISDNIFQCVMPNEEPGRHTGIFEDELEIRSDGSREAACANALKVKMLSSVNANMEKVNSGRTQIHFNFFLL